MFKTHLPPHVPSIMHHHLTADELVESLLASGQASVATIPIAYTSFGSNAALALDTIILHIQRFAEKQEISATIDAEQVSDVLSIAKISFHGPAPAILPVARWIASHAALNYGAA